LANKIFKLYSQSSHNHSSGGRKNNNHVDIDSGSLYSTKDHNHNISTLTSECRNP